MKTREKLNHIHKEYEKELKEEFQFHINKDSFFEIMSPAIYFNKNINHIAEVWFDEKKLFQHFNWYYGIDFIHFDSETIIFFQVKKNSENAMGKFVEDCKRIYENLIKLDDEKIKLFAKITNWNISQIKNLKRMIQSHGYEMVYSAFTGGSFSAFIPEVTIFNSREIIGKYNINNLIYTRRNSVTHRILPNSSSTGQNILLSNNDKTIDCYISSNIILAMVEKEKKAKNSIEALFTSNVREFKGENTLINSTMQATIKDQVKNIEFAKYNNGITLIADEVCFPAKNIKLMNDVYITIKNPQIINGQQTFRTIYETISNMPKDSRPIINVSLRVHSNLNEDQKISVSKFTNSMTRVSDRDILTRELWVRNLKRKFADQDINLILKGRVEDTDSYSSSILLIDFIKYMSSSLDGFYNFANIEKQILRKYNDSMENYKVKDYFINTSFSKMKNMAKLINLYPFIMEQIKDNLKDDNFVHKSTLKDAIITRIFKNHFENEKYTQKNNLVVEIQEIIEFYKLENFNEITKKDIRKMENISKLFNLKSTLTEPNEIILDNEKTRKDDFIDTINWSIDSIDIFAIVKENLKWENSTTLYEEYIDVEWNSCINKKTKTIIIWALENEVTIDIKECFDEEDVILAISNKIKNSIK